MTQWFSVTVEALGPVSIGRTNAKAHLTRTAPVVTGSALRGALAAWWLRNKDQDAKFRSLFDGDVRFGPLLREDCILENLSVSTCKYHRGDGHPRFVDRAFSSKTPVVCSGAPEPLKGRYVLAGGGRPDLEIATSTAHNPATGTALEGALFSRESNSTGSRFRGHIVGCADLLGLLPEQLRLTLGGRSGVQGGSVATITKASAPSVSGSRHVLRTLSPTILIDAAGRPSTDLASALSAHGVTVVQVFADRVSTEGAGGWNAAAGLPKPTDIALVPGSIAVIDGPAQTVARLLDRGLGVRRPEGFGFLDLVTAPWALDDSARAQPVTPPPADGGILRWASALDEAGLNAGQRTWIAQQLNDLREGQHAEVAERLARPGAGTLSSGQRALVEDILLNCPGHLRTALARVIRHGVS